MRTRKGFTLVELMIVVAIVAVVSSIAIPNILSARKHGNETAAVGALKTIAVVQTIFREADKDRDGRADYGTLSELSSTQLIDSVLGSGTKQGYLFQASYSTTTSEFLWFAVANPAAPKTTGDRYFETNQNAVIFYTTAGAFTLNTTTCGIAAGARPVGK